MAKAKTDKGTAVVVAKKNAIVADVPAYLKDYQGRTGTEGIDNDDIVVPRIKIGQGMSEEVKSGDLKEGAQFLNIDGEELAAPGAPLKIVPLWRGKEYILWRPREDQGGGILARAKPVVEDGVVRYKWDKPNQKFSVKVKGVLPVTWEILEYVDDNNIGEWGSEVPGDASSGIAATLHNNYIVALPDFNDQLAAMSLTRTNNKFAKKFNTLLKKLGNQGIPMFSRQFDATTKDEARDAKTVYKVVEFSNSDPAFVPDEKFATYERMFKGFDGKSLAVDEEDRDDEDKASSKSSGRAL